MDDIDDFQVDDFRKKFGAHLSRIRKTKGYSQDKVSLEAGLARGTLSKIESGLVEPKIATIARLAITLGIPLKKMFDFKF